MLFNNLDKFQDRVALIEENGNTTSYARLNELVSNFQQRLPKSRQLIFIEVQNSLVSIIAYIACIKAKHSVLLLLSKSHKANKKIIEKYQPNLVIDASTEEATIQVINEGEIDLHEELSHLLTTSGSSGSPKLVKLSRQNIWSNTCSIINYLKLSKDDIAITSMDFNYSYGLSIVNTHLSCGAAIVLTQKSSMDENFWDIFKRFNVTSFSGVPYNFEMLHTQNFTFKEMTSLRYLTQAGGKLSPQLVEYFGNIGNANGFDFIVMYGQTEASPRISYLPHKYAEQFPNSIGLPIPDGELIIVDDNGENIDVENLEGELQYRGPNVMMGYAHTINDLNSKEEIEWLKTGDLAMFTSNNLVVITGRLSRFAKPFGIRLNLDDVQEYLTVEGLRGGVVSIDEQIIIALENTTIIKEDLLFTLAKKYKIPHTSFQFIKVEAIPRLANGKINYRKLLTLYEKSKNSLTAKITNMFSIFIDELKINTGLKTQNRQSVLEIYTFYFPTESVTMKSSFTELSGDSLLYVTVALELESLLDSLPENWMELTIDQLQCLKTMSND